MNLKQQNYIHYFQTNDSEDCFKQEKNIYKLRTHNKNMAPNINTTGIIIITYNMWVVVDKYTIDCSL